MATILAQTEDIKKEMCDYLERGNSWVDLCEKYCNNEVKALLPDVYKKMNSVLKAIDYIEKTIGL